MTRTIGQRELRNDNAKIIDAVAGGETFVVTRHGTPIAELRPVQDSRARLVPRAALVEASRSAPHIDRHRLRADLDRFADQRL